MSIELRKLHKEKAKPFCEGSPTLKKVLRSRGQRLFIKPEEKKQEIKIDEPETVSMKNIRAVLEALGYDRIDFENGKASKDSKNFLKIGKILRQNKCNVLLNSWRKMTNQTSTSRKGTVLCVSLNPVDILSASHNRRWHSCLAPNGCCYRDLGTNILKDSKFSFIIYEVEEGDTNIKRPKGRALVHAYITGSKSKKTISKRGYVKGLWYSVSVENVAKDTRRVACFDKDTTYGSFSVGVQREIKKFIAKINKEIYDEKVNWARFIGYYRNGVSLNLYKGNIKKKHETSKPRKPVKRKPSTGATVENIIFGKAKNKVKRTRCSWSGSRWRINQGPAIIEDLVKGEQVSTRRLNQNMPVLKLYQVAGLLKTKAKDCKNLIGYLGKSRSKERKILLENLT